jgi:hypothetical protein
LSSRTSKSIAGKGLNGDSHNDNNASTDTEYLNEVADTPVSDSTIDDGSWFYESSAEEESSSDNGSSEAVASDQITSEKDFDFPPTPGAPHDQLVPLVFDWEGPQGNEYCWLLCGNPEATDITSTLEHLDGVWGVTS